MFGGLYLQMMRLVTHLVETYLKYRRLLARKITLNITYEEMSLPIMIELARSLTFRYPWGSH